MAISQTSQTGAEHMTIAMENQLVSRARKGTGIASFVIGMVSIIAITALVGIAGVLTQSGKISPSINMMLGFGVIAVAMVDFFGIGLGVAGAADRSSRKVFPVLG